MPAAASSEGPRTGRVVLVVSGGIAAYKSAEVVRLLREEAADVRVALTKAATRFVGATTFAALSGNTCAPVSSWTGGRWKRGCRRRTHP